MTVERLGYFPLNLLSTNFIFQMLLNATKEHFSIGNVAKLKCDLGYVINDQVSEMRITRLLQFNFLRFAPLDGLKD